MEADVKDWTNQPRFWCRVSVSSRTWSVKFGYDRRTKAGKIYGMVDKGTASYAGGSSYPITPRKPGGALRFMHPTPIKTTPGIAGIGPGLVRQQGGVERGVIYTKKVEHPGIRPRHFTKSLRELLLQRTRPGGLRSTTDAAVKRAFRKISR